MFLLNIRTRRLESYFNDLQVPPYYILSHVWGADEVTYQDVRDSPSSALEHRRGWQKIVGFCEMLIASERWLQSHNSFKRLVSHVWVDTCCINKDSSAELSEAINSMYAWYSRAVACIVYLEDVSTPAIRNFRVSKWFTRGWTLQELLSPEEVHFYTRSWQHIGDRFGLGDVICERTGVHPKFLERDEIWRASIAEKMSWAAKRQTTRSEDIAYCLMGLFGINMPLLYGEGGENAFIRLQEEILKESTDESIFAWDATGEPDGAGMLATHPARFHHGASIVPLRTRKNPDAVKNGGIIMNASCIKTSQPDLWNVVLDCTTEGAPEHKRIAIQVIKGPDCSRTPMPLSMISRSSEPEQLFFLKRRIAPPKSQDLHLCEVSWNSESFTLLEAWPGPCWAKTPQPEGTKKPGQESSQSGQSKYSLSVRHAWRMAADAGLVEHGRLFAAMALSMRSAPQETVVIGIAFMDPNGKYAITLKTIGGAAASANPQTFRDSYNRAIVANQIEDWAAKKGAFSGSDSPVLDISSRRVAVRSAYQRIDRRHGLIVSLGERNLGNEAHNSPVSRDGTVPSSVDDSVVIRPETITRVPAFEYWKPFDGHETLGDIPEVSEIIYSKRWHR